MKIVHDTIALKELLDDSKSKNNSIAFVSTMGALHDGHLSLVVEAKKKADVVVVGIFLNPLHFAEGEDFDRYPRTLTMDCQKLDGVSADIAFVPSVEQIYPEGISDSVCVLIPRLNDVYCGASRPHFFGAVCTVVAKLLNIVRPDYAYFGEKDYQQLVICRRMVEALMMDVEVVGVPTVRTCAGLALSSRSVFLTPSDLEIAPELYRQLIKALEEAQVFDGDIERIEKSSIAHLNAIGFEVECFCIVDGETLGKLTSGSKKLVVLAAAVLGGVRLIDNVSCARALAC